jgi:hypothetical protein
MDEALVQPDRWLWLILSTRASLVLLVFSPKITLYRIRQEAVDYCILDVYFACFSLEWTGHLGCPLVRCVVETQYSPTRSNRRRRLEFLPFAPMVSSAPKLSYLPDFEGRKSLYTRLQYDEIRVLTVWPSEDFVSPLECTLQTRSLVASDTFNKFDALSYYWGSVNDLEYVLVHGSDNGAPIPSCEVPVTKSLTSALREFRKRATTAGEPLEMWTDALCINQRDAKERDFQLKAMWLIYESSRRVRVWLGDHSGSKAAENGLASLVTFSEYFKDHAFEAKELLDESAGPLLETPSVASKLLNSVGALMELPYWYRGWTMQEAVAAPPIFLHFGGQGCELLGWELFYFTLQKIDDFAKERNLSIGALTADLWLILQPFVQVAMSRRRLDDPLPMTDSYLKIAEEIFHSVLDNKMWHTTDPRDYVFVLRGFHTMFEELRTGYGNTVEDVYSDATEILLRKGGTWSRGWWCLPYASPYLPSWAIDFSVGSEDALEEPRAVDDTLLQMGKFNASASSSIRIELTGLQTLVTAAFIYDEIETISRCPTHDERDSHGIDYMEKLSLEWLMLGQETMAKDPFATLRTLCVNMALDFKPFTRHDMDLFCYHPIGTALKVPMIASGGRPRPKQFELFLERVKRWFSWIRRVALHKRFFVTKSGRMGLAPLSATAGDHIAIFASGDMPFVVRRVHANAEEGAHILLGGCYLDGKSFNGRRYPALCVCVDRTGAMHGEAVHEQGERIFDELQNELSSRELRRHFGMDLSSGPHNDTAHKSRTTELSPRKRCHMLKRTRSLDSGQFAKAVAVELAFREDLCLV